MVLKERYGIVLSSNENGLEQVGLCLGRKKETRTLRRRLHSSAFLRLPFSARQQVTKPIIVNYNHSLISNLNCLLPESIIN